MIREGGPSALGAMMKQEEFAFIKASSAFQLSPALLRELRKAIAARRRRRKTLAPSKAKTFNVAPTERHSTAFGAGREAQPSRKPPQQLAGNRESRQALQLRRLDGACHQTPSARSAI